jgi:hypothetical protein
MVNMPSTRAFLSYSSLDKKIVLMIKKELDKRGILTWLDEFQVGFGESIRREIEQGIAESNFLILFMSKTAFKSEWVNREIDAAFMMEVESKNVLIVPVLLDNCEIPISLKSKRYIDLRQDYPKGIIALIDTLLFPRKTVLRELTGRWIGESGALYLFLAGNLVTGKYDWVNQKSGNIFGHVEKKRIKFNWLWDYSAEHGMGIFDLDDTYRKLVGGWWYNSAEIDPDISFEELCKTEGFHKWDFKKDIKTIRLTNNPSEEVLGVLYTDYRHFSVDDEEKAKAFANQAALALEKSILDESMESIKTSWNKKTKIQNKPNRQKKKR